MAFLSGTRNGLLIDLRALCNPLRLSSLIQVHHVAQGVDHAIRAIGGEGQRPLHSRGCAKCLLCGPVGNILPLSHLPERIEIVLLLNLIQAGGTRHLLTDACQLIGRRVHRRQVAPSCRARPADPAR